MRKTIRHKATLIILAAMTFISFTLEAQPAGQEAKEPANVFLPGISKI